MQDRTDREKANSRLQDIAEDVKQIQTLHKKAAITGNIRLLLSVLTFILNAVGFVTSLTGWLTPWIPILTFTIIAILLLVLIYFQSGPRDLSPSFRETRQKAMPILKEARLMVEAMLKYSDPTAITSLIDIYYDILRSLCTILQEDAPSIFDQVLWDHWQLEEAPRSSTLNSSL